MNDTELKEVAALSAENSDLKAKLEAATKQRDEANQTSEALSKKLADAQADNAAMAHARDTFKTGFETQQQAHNDAIKIIEKLKAQLKSPVTTDSNGQPAAVQ